MSLVSNECDAWEGDVERKGLPEFERAVGNLGEIKSSRILWPLILTQYCVEIRKFP